MLCKKCGATIEDNSKFCGYCGEVVSEVNQLNQNIRETNQKLDQIQPGGISNNQTSQAESVLNIFGNVNNDTQNTISTQPSIEVNSQPINSEVNASEISSENTITSNQNTIEVQHSDINTVSVEAANIQSVNNEENNVNEIPNIIQSTVEVNPQLINNEVNMIKPLNESTSTLQPISETPNVSVNSQPTSNEGSTNKNTNKNNKKIFIIIGAILGVVAVAIICFLFLTNSGNNLSVLKKSIANLELNNKNSFTINVNLITNDDTNKEISFNALIKSQKKSEDKTNMQITVNKTEMFEEINSYLVLNSDKVELYLQSTLVDLLGLTSSLEPIWIYNSIDLNDLEIEELKKEGNEKISLDQIVDAEHFVLIDKVNGVKHYQLIIDQKLIDDIKVKFADSENENIKSIIESDTTLEKPVKIDFYITKSNEIEKININLLDLFGEDMEVSKMLLSIKFSNFNSTVVDIPNEVQTGIYDLQTYIATHGVEFNFDFNTNDNF